jgi:hypothetical protein
MRAVGCGFFLLLFQRPPGIVFDNESEVLIDKIDHFCPWTATTIAGNNYREFQIFVVCIFTHLTITAVVAVAALLYKAYDAAGGGTSGDNGTTAVLLV